MAGRDKSPDVMDSSDFTLSSATEPDLSDIISTPDVSVKKITKHLMQRKQMSHDMQVMKIELNQKTLALENVKAEYQTKEEEMQEKINELQHQKSLLQSRLETELEMHRSETRRRQDNTKREFESAMLKQSQLEETNNRLILRASDLKRQLTLDSLHLNDEEYEELRVRQERDISVKEFVAMRFFEVFRPVERELIEFRNRLAEIEEDKRMLGEERAELAEALSRERELHLALQEDYQKTLTALADTKALVQHGDYKIENFDRVRDDRDRNDSALSELRERHAQLEIAHESLLRERDDLQRDLTSARQAVTLLTQDKDYLTKQGAEAASRAAHTEERVHLLTRQLDDAKQAREELYEKYVRARDEYKSTYELRLHDEMNQLRVRTDAEVERLKTSTQEANERENRALRLQREEAFAERERADSRCREATAKYEALQRDLSALQSSADARLGDLVSDVKMKAFEVERTSLMLEETRARLKDSELNNDKLQAKLETVTREFYNLETDSAQRLAELETRAQEQKVKLDGYEAVESELDNVVMQAAEQCEVEDVDLERVTFAFADGARLPSTARRRMQQSVHLARRVLALERKIRELNQELEKSREEREKAMEEAERAHAMLNDVQQPYGYLVDNLRTRDEQLAKQRDHIASLEAECRNVKKERSDLLRVKNQMTADLEKLLSQREELTMLKQLMADLKEKRNSRAARSERRRGDNVGFAGEEKAYHMTKSNPDEKDPEWARILKQRNVEPKNSDGKKVYGTYYS